MASKRRLKKAVNRFMFDVIEECSFQIIYLPETDVEKCEKTIANVVALRNEWIERINSAKKAEQPKVNYKSVVDDFANKSAEIVTDLFA